MKRQTIFFSVALSVVLCAAMAGCAPGSAENRAIEEAKNAKGIEVTEEEWNEAMTYFQRADAEYTVEGEWTVETDDYHIQWGYPYAFLKMSIRSFVKDKRVYLRENYITDFEDQEQEDQFVSTATWIGHYPELYAAVTEDGSFIYAQDKEGGWYQTKAPEEDGWGWYKTKSPTAALTDVAFGDMIVIVGVLTESLPLDYKSYQYDAENGTYAYVNIDGLLTYTFDKIDGKIRLTSIYVQLNEGPGPGVKSESACVFSYSAPDIILPEVGEE